MIGVVETEGASDLAAALEAAGASAMRGPATEVAAAAPDAAVAVGERALVDLVRAGIDAPVLPVGVEGLRSVAPERGRAAARDLAAGEFETRRRPLIGARLDGERVGRALFDVVAATSEPGRISEYAVGAAEPIDRFRADGIVVATPAGSHGYANAAGGPVLREGVGALVVVPLAAFAVRSDRWVVDLGDGDPALSVSVEREENPVSLLVDGREAGTLPPDRPLRIAADGVLDVAVAGGGDESVKL